jgi:hypothetical protein
MATPVEIINQAALPFAGLFNRARLGFPRYFFQGNEHISGDLMGTTVFRELRKRGGHGIAVATQHRDLFRHNPDVDKIIHHPRPRLDRCLRHGLPLVRLGQTAYDPVRDADEPPDEHILIKMCRRAGVTGKVELRPYLFLTREEFAAGNLGKDMVVMQSSNLASPTPMRNREWYPNRFQEVCAILRSDVTVVQIGAASDPKLEGAIDKRGRTTLRQSAAILAQSLAFVGLAGFLMHLARAVDCRAVIVYGGREKPSQTGYVANKNLYNQVRCAPCWLRNPCEFDRKCMDMITVDQVIAATADQISRYGTLLEVQTAEL